MIKIFKKIYKFFDLLEDRVRGRLSKTPLIYALIGAITTVSIWRGVWEVSDKLNISAWVSLIGGILLAMLTGLFVSFFIGENIVISGLQHEKRTDEKTKEEIIKEEGSIDEIKKDIKEIKEILLKNKE
ncbi:MAG: hypothetical protein EOM85_00050 [Candidatus Moranbacteria bacterium]|nr:hypothetical protein [Candidatus Moranbacteria bacterium]